jgi:PAS domain S-box-containing protein
VRERAKAYLLAIAALAVSVVLRLLLDPWLGDTLPFVTIFGAVAYAGWTGGYGPAALVVALGYVATHYLFIPPRGQFGLRHALEFIGLLAYLFTCAVIVLLGESARRATRQANQRRELLRVTLRSIGDAVITTDTDGRVTYLNDVAVSLTGWTTREAIGRPLEDVFRIVNEDTRAPVQSPAARALREGVIVGLANHTVLLKRDGTESPIDDSAAPIRDESGNVSGCVLIFRDVTAHRRADLERREQLHTARLLAAIVESSDDAIVSKTLDGIIQSWNAGAERLFGYTAEQAVGRHISLVIPPDRRSEEDLIIARLRAGERIEHFETERVRADGQRIFVSLTISPIRDARGDVVGASKIVRDVTERRQLADNLQALARDLSDADRRKNEFLAMLAHELRNPLAPISNAARALRLGAADQATVRTASEMLERQVAQLSRLVDDLLDVSRISRGKIELRRAPTELGPIVRQAVEGLRPAVAAMRHELMVEIPDSPLVVDADAARIAQVIGNLLNNAGKFTDAGGRIWLTVAREGADAVIRVRDDGIGIAAEHLPMVFEMFAQVDTSLERSRDGLGIGLTLVKTLVELHGGSVVARSDGPGRGSEFTVRLPVVDDVRPAEPVPEAAAAGIAPARRVLIVDDNVDGAESLALLLRFAGHVIEVAHDGEAALAVAGHFRPEVALLDIGLPGLNGYEVCQRLRREPWGQAMTIVALTGWGQDDDRRRSSDAGFDRHMVKPVDPPALLELLARVRANAPSAEA